MQIDTELLSLNFMLSELDEDPLLPVVRWMVCFSLRGIVCCLLSFRDVVVAKEGIITITTENSYQELSKSYM